MNRLTSHLCHSHHFYFTQQSRYADGRKLLFHSDRKNAKNLYSLDWKTGKIQQLTGFSAGEPGVGSFEACLNQVRQEVYYWRGSELYSHNLSDLSERLLWERPQKVQGGQLNCSCDGEYLYFILSPDLSDRLSPTAFQGQIASQEYWALHPHCQLMRMPSTGGEVETMWEEDHWLGHINTSPVMPHLLTFCHEGPWPLVEQRMWGLDTYTGSAWKIRPETEGDVVGHEYWLADGTGVGYHGRTRERSHLWGHANYLGGDYCDYTVARRSMHFHSLGIELLVSDGMPEYPYIILWRWNGEQYEGALLCQHGCSFHKQQLHVHPAMTPDGRGVVFTSDINSYGNIYYVGFPEFESLPPVPAER